MKLREFIETLNDFVEAYPRYLDFDVVAEANTFATRTAYPVVSMRAVILAGNNESYQHFVIKFKDDSIDFEEDTAVIKEHTERAKKSQLVIESEDEK